MPEPGAPIRVSFCQPGGGVLGTTLPLGAVTTRYRIDGRTVRASLIDVVNPLLLVDAGDLGCSPDIGPQALEQDQDVMGMLAHMRDRAAASTGLASSVDEAQRESPTVPFVGLCGPPTAYTSLTGDRVAAEEQTLTVRLLSTGTAHRAVPLAALAAAAASRMPDTVAHRAAGSGDQTAVVRLGHPSGLLGSRFAPAT